MSQESVYKFLKKNRRWMKTLEISKKVRLSRSTCSDNLLKLFKSRYIRRKKDTKNGWKCYYWKIR